MQVRGCVEIVFAGTPPLKFVGLVLSMTASVKAANESKQWLPGLRDATNASYRAECKEPFHAYPRKGKDHPGVVWQLKRAMRGTRVALKTFQGLIIKVLTQHGELIRLEVKIMVFWRRTSYNDRGARRRLLGSWITWCVRACASSVAKLCGSAERSSMHGCTRTGRWDGHR